MCLKNTIDHYGLVSRYLHGVVMVLFLGILLFGSLLGLFPKPILRDIAVNAHKCVGLIALSVGIVFLLWSFITIKPRYPESMPTHERYLAKLVRFLLYIMMVIMPLSGWMMVTAAGKFPHVGNLTFPCPFVPFDFSITKAIRPYHTYFAWILTGLIVLHVMGALKHHLIDRNNVLSRMFT